MSTGRFIGYVIFVSIPYICLIYMFFNKYYNYDIFRIGEHVFIIFQFIVLISFSFQQYLYEENGTLNPDIDIKLKFSEIKLFKLLIIIFIFALVILLKYYEIIEKYELYFVLILIIIFPYSWFHQIRIGWRKYKSSP